MTRFPTTLDTFQNPGAATTEDAAGFEHDVQHSNANDALAALQAKVGVNGSTDANSVDAKLAALNALIFPAGAATVKFAVVGGQVMLCIYDTGLAAYVPLISNNGTLGVGSPIS